MWLFSTIASVFDTIAIYEALSMMIAFETIMVLILLFLEDK